MRHRGVEPLTQALTADLLEEIIQRHAFRYGKGWKWVFDLGQLDVAAVGELHGARAHFFMPGKGAVHLVCGLDEELFGVELEMLGVVDGGGSLNAQQDFVRAVHSIKGASSNFGADDLHDMCAEVEQMGRAGKMNETGEKVAAIHAEFEKVRAALLAEVA